MGRVAAFEVVTFPIWYVFFGILASDYTNLNLGLQASPRHLNPGALHVEFHHGRL